MKCEKCGWKMDHRPRSFQEQFKEIIERQDKKGYWMHSNCGFKITQQRYSGRV